MDHESNTEDGKNWNTQSDEEQGVKEGGSKRIAGFGLDLWIERAAGE
jgi:hypothetical protein